MFTVKTATAVFTNSAGPQLWPLSLLSGNLFGARYGFENSTVCDVVIFAAPAADVAVRLHGGTRRTEEADNWLRPLWLSLLSRSLAG